jgi:hypothetical protein
VAKVIEFYIPTKFSKRVKWIPPQRERSSNSGCRQRSPPEPKWMAPWSNLRSEELEREANISHFLEGMQQGIVKKSLGDLRYFHSCGSLVHEIVPQ